MPLKGIRGPLPLGDPFPSFNSWPPWDEQFCSATHTDTHTHSHSYDDVPPCHRSNDKGKWRWTEASQPVAKNHSDGKLKHLSYLPTPLSVFLGITSITFKFFFINFCYLFTYLFIFVALLIQPRASCFITDLYAYLYFFWNRVSLCCPGWLQTLGFRWASCISLLNRWDYSCTQPH
jgi:hypothetical protein